MIKTTTRWGLDPETQYGRPVFEAILAGVPSSFDSTRIDYVVDERGVWVKHPDEVHGLDWHPWSEVNLPGSPDPLVEPWLPFPFTARQLAALLMDGWGYFIRQALGDWDDGPDPVLLDRLGSRGAKAREALTLAYEAGRMAIHLAPSLNESLLKRARRLSVQFDQANNEANRREAIREPGISKDEYNRRREIAKESVSALRKKAVRAQTTADAAETAWRRAVVQHLLLPISEVPEDAFGDLAFQVVPPSDRAQFIYERQLGVEWRASEAGKAHWARISEHMDLENDLRAWQLLTPSTVTEKDLRDGHIARIRARVAELKLLIDDPPLTTPADHRGDVEETRDDRRRRRLADLRRFGGEMVSRGGGWYLRDRRSGAFAKLCVQEQTRGASATSPKTIRADLRAQAQAEEDARRAGLLAASLVKRG